MMKIPVSRGNIIDVDLSGAIGVEKQNDAKAGTRPCLVVQNEKGNRHSPMTIVAPITDARQAKLLPVQVEVTAEELGFAGAKPSVVECGHLRTIDGDARVKTHRGTLSESAMKRVDKAIAVSVGLK
jgi:mRNA interferase MazF